MKIIGVHGHGCRPPSARGRTDGQGRMPIGRARESMKNSTYLQVPPHFTTPILPSVLTFWAHPELSLPATFPVPPVDFHILLSAPGACDHSTLYVSPSLSRRAQCPLRRTLPSGVVSTVPAHSPVVWKCEPDCRHRRI